MEVLRNTFTQRKLDEAVLTVGRAVICLILILDRHMPLLSLMIHRVTTLVLCFDMVRELWNSFRMSRGGDRTRHEAQVGLYYASALWIAVFDNDNSTRGFRIIQILVLWGDLFQQKHTGTTHGASVMVLFLFMNYHVRFASDESPGHASLLDFSRRNIYFNFQCKSNTSQPATDVSGESISCPRLRLTIQVDCANFPSGDKPGNGGWARSEIISLVSSTVMPLVSPALGAFWGSIFALACPKILQRMSESLKDRRKSRTAASGARRPWLAALRTIPPRTENMEVGTRVTPTQNFQPSTHVLPPPAAASPSHHMLRSSG
ncbi:hypothetical protein BDP55DRAFT_631052 [Colletotrichum godetiae]|uniref:Uncharacterized protein n=1 Tax=Colletotrichum godetiae TaxID=1209918 RepID=A0AAJ0APV5_9PEZI|nr:uncharacterized protein BDP55DRAFT_631052 [Colletotrichum godetiae]KAK1676408.1 hypothetical protein BDP55DRAFT_631052 [Colletotrichum godetiae]